MFRHNTGLALIFAPPAVYNADMKRISKYIVMMCLFGLILSSCAHHCSCDQDIIKSQQIPAAGPIAEGTQLLNDCTSIKDAITESNVFSQKMANSRYAVYYQAMSRERVAELQTRAKLIGCP